MTPNNPHNHEKQHQSKTWNSKNFVKTKICCAQMMGHAFVCFCWDYSDSDLTEEMDASEGDGDAEDEQKIGG